MIEIEGNKAVSSGPWTKIFPSLGIFLPRLILRFQI